MSAVDAPKKFSRICSLRMQFMPGVLCLMNVPCAWVREHCGVSRAYYYQLRDCADRILSILYPPTGGFSDILLINKDFIRRCVTGLRMYCRASIQGIISFFDNVLLRHISRGEICNITQAACRSAFQFNAGVQLSNIFCACIDEIFLRAQGKGLPVLTGVDPHSQYVFMALHVKDRTGATWARMLNRLKAQGFDPQSFPGDPGNGLISGAGPAFPDAEAGHDVFHVLYNPGRIVSQVVRHVDSRLKEYDKCMEVINSARAAGRKPDRRTVASLAKLPGDLHTTMTDNAIMLPDLYEWFREIVSFNGCSADVSLNPGNRILDEMAALYPRHRNLQKAINGAREALPGTLGFQRFLESRPARSARASGVSLDDRLLLCCQRFNCRTDNCEAVGRRLWHRYGRNLAPARDALNEHLDFIQRASSPVENFNSRCRTCADLKGDNISSVMDELIVFCENTRKQGRTRNGWSGTSACDRLTGETHPEFPDLLCGVRDCALVHVA